jgi:thiamine-phosphate pyrophosphorylase
MSDCQLYVVSPPVIADVTGFAERLERVLDAGGEQIGAFQLRLKQIGSGSEETGRLTDRPAEREDILRASEQLIPLCERYDVPFIMNDAPTLAQAAGAHGVHLGQEDGDIAQARALLGEEAVIGVSCHASGHLAMEAGEAGADYVAFGAFYPTRSKSSEALAYWGTPQPDIVRWWSTYTVLPCVAIGGITPDNARPLVEAGADFLAVLSGIWQHEGDEVSAVNRYLECLS